MHNAVPIQTHEHVADGAERAAVPPEESRVHGAHQELKNSDLGGYLPANDVSRGASEKSEGWLT
jgi:hypothetical protein